MLKKSAMFTDIHFGRRGNSEEHNNDCMNYVEWFCSRVKEDSTIDHIIFLGDWHEHRSSINGLTLQNSFDSAKKLSELGIPVYFIIGNHDLYYRNNRNTFTTYTFQSLPNFILVDEVTEIPAIVKTAVFPYLMNEEYPTLLEYIDYPVVYGHFELKGFVLTGLTNIMEHGPDHTQLFKTQKRVFSGHFHKRQHSNNVHYIGNTFPMDYGDANDTLRGMAVYDYVNDKLTFINWEECPKFVRGKLSEYKDVKLPFQSRVKLDVDIPMTYEESNTLKSELIEKYKLRELTLNELVIDNVTLSDDGQYLQDQHIESTENIIYTLISRIDSKKIDTQLLLNIYKEL